MNHHKKGTNSSYKICNNNFILSLLLFHLKSIRLIRISKVLQAKVFTLLSNMITLIGISKNGKYNIKFWRNAMRITWKMISKTEHSWRNIIKIIENVSKRCKCFNKRQNYWKSNHKNWENLYSKEIQICWKKKYSLEKYLMRLHFKRVTIIDSLFLFEINARH